MKLRKKNRKFAQRKLILSKLTCYADHPLCEPKLTRVKKARLSAIKDFCRMVQQWFDDHKHLFTLDIEAVDCHFSEAQGGYAQVQIHRYVDISFKNINSAIRIECYSPHWSGGECGCYVDLKDTFCGIFFEQTIDPIELTGQRWGVTGCVTLPSERGKDFDHRTLIYANFAELYATRVLQPLMNWINDTFSQAQSVYIYGEDPKDPFQVLLSPKKSTKDPVTIIPIHVVSL